MKITASVASVALLVVAGCSSSTGGGGAAAARPPVRHEGSVTTKDGSFVKYPNGLTVRLTKVTTKPASRQDPDYHPGDVEVWVTESLSNQGGAPVSLTSDLYFQTQLYYGANRYQADGFASFDNPHDSMNLPQRLVPGTSALVTSSYTMPKSQLGTLAFEVNPDAQKYTSYTFTDVQTLLDN